MKVGDKAFIIQSGRNVREVELAGVAVDGFIVKFVDTGGGICVNRSRLFKLEEDPYHQRCAASGISDGYGR